MDLVTFYGYVSTGSDPLLCVYTSWSYRTAEADRRIEALADPATKAMAIGAAHFREARVLPQKAWFAGTQLHPSYLPILDDLENNPRASVPAVRASDLLHAISAPQIPTTAAQNIAQRRAQFEQYIAGLNRAIMEKEPFLGLFRVDWKERRLIRDAQVTLRQLEQAGQQEAYQAACAAGKIARHMSPTDIFVNENSGDLVTQLNKAVFEAAYLPKAPGQSSAQRCPASYDAFLQQHDSARRALFERYLADCEDRPAAQSAGYPRDTPVSEEDLQQLKQSATSPSHQQLVRSIIAAALRLCPADPFKDPERLDDMSAARCAGLPEGTDREALLRRLRVIRGVLHTEFYNAFGIRDDAAAIAKAWGKVKRHIERLEER